MTDGNRWWEGHTYGSQIDLFKNYLYLIGLCANTKRKTSEDTTRQKVLIWMYSERNSLKYPLTCWHAIEIN